MKWFIAACVVLLAVAVVTIQWTSDDEPAGTPLTTATASHGADNFTDIPASQRKGDTRSSVNSLSTVNAETNGTEAFAANTAAAGANPVPRAGCVRKQSEGVENVSLSEAGTDHRDKDLASNAKSTAKIM